MSRSWTHNYSLSMPCQAFGGRAAAPLKKKREGNVSTQLLDRNHKLSPAPLKFEVNFLEPQIMWEQAETK